MSLKYIVNTKEDKTSRMNNLLANNPSGELIKVIYDKAKVYCRAKKIYKIGSVIGFSMLASKLLLP